MDEVELMQLPPNVNTEPIHVEHAKLERWDEESAFKSKCPKCEGGMLPVQRDRSTFQITNIDRCLECGQQFIYDDTHIAGQRVKKVA